jgi:bifunctional UDP-N-acetylglucosamine pyrophosphorylase/glucosamine-1-phosphate N-acetyltransferase
MALMSMNNLHKNHFSCIILAAGRGTRMKSALPKVMHKLAGLPLISHVVRAVSPLSPQKTVIVTAPNMQTVRDAVANVVFAVQDKQLGTAHSVGCALPELTGFTGSILVLCGDTPLIETGTLQKMLQAAESSEIVVLGMRMSNPTGYGRLLVDESGKLQGIIEEKDASCAQKQINLCNSGVMVVNGAYLPNLLKKVGNNNASNEYYLTDIVAIAGNSDLRASVVEARAEELMGINTRAQLAEAEKILQQKLRVQAMENGVTFTAPETVFLQVDTKIAADVIIQPNVIFGKGVTVETGVEIRSFSHIEGAHIKTGATIGPFARIRPNSVIGENSHIGNFVELKNTTLHKGAKINHLSYIGDAEVGAKANVGAGTITCNYDGVSKHKTKIGAGAFIGSNASLVAPVTIGDGAVVGAGSVITNDIPAQTLAIARARQVNKE